MKVIKKKNGELKLILEDGVDDFKTNETLFKYLKENNLTMDDMIYEAQKELRKLNYSYSHMQVVLYDERINTLEIFINNINKKDRSLYL